MIEQMLDGKQFILRDIFNLTSLIGIDLIIEAILKITMLVLGLH